MKTVCFFGIYDPNYSRNRVLMHGFRQNGWQVTECRVDPRAHPGIGKYWKLWKLGLTARRAKPDMVILAFPAQTIAWMGRLLFGKGVIFDAFLSLYDSNVFDRKMYSATSWQGKKDFFLDRLAARISHRTLLDTHEHIAYYSETFGVPREKFLRVVIGADDRLFVPREASPAKSDTFMVEFHGMFIPLQGVDHIVRAAAILKNENIVFNIVGNGQTFKEVKQIVDDEGLTNVNLLGQVPSDKISDYIAAGDVCLGIFGDTEKTGRVIPNKVYECAAMGKPIISADSTAIRELFTDGKDMLFSRASDPESIASAILKLRNDPALRLRLGMAARNLYLANCTPNIIVKQLLRDLDEK